jgi:CRISPR/Cas system CSM-associated protein Csm4 (group 5 of RAMP superfamily)
MGRLEEWLDATARNASPEVCFSSCFPFVEEIGFVIPPRTVWPPPTPSTMAGIIRWKSARFIPLAMVQSILSGERLDGNRWTVDGPSGCLMPTGRQGPFRTAVRWSAAVDRLSGASERHSTACIEFRPGAGLWTVIGFTDDTARDRWQEAVQAAFRLLADTGFGGERSRGWGRAETPEFIEGELPGMILGDRQEARVSGPDMKDQLTGAKKRAGSKAAPDQSPEATASGQSATPDDKATAPEAPAPSPDQTVAPDESGSLAQVPETSAAAPDQTAAPDPTATPAPDENSATAAPEPSTPAHSDPPAEAAPRAESAPDEPVDNPPEEPSPVPPLEEPPVETPPVTDPVPEPEEPTPPVTEPTGLRAKARDHGRAHWMLSLFTPSPADAVDWARGSYTLMSRGGRIESPVASGELKKQIQMIAEGSVLVAESAPRGSAPDVAPDGFAHPVFRAGFALAIPLPEGN